MDLIKTYVCPQCRAIFTYPIPKPTQSSKQRAYPSGPLIKLSTNLTTEHYYLTIPPPRKMRFTVSIALLLCASTVASAAVLRRSNGFVQFDDEPSIERRATYSIVNVDGAGPSSTQAAPSSSNAPAAPANPAPTTVATVLTTTATVAAPPAQTVLSTVTISGVVTVITVTTTTTLEPSSQTATLTEVVQPSTIVTTTTTELPVTTQVSVFTQPGSTATVTQVVSPVTASTEYYDNGMWHTLYPIKTFSTLIASASASASNATSA